MHRSRDIKGSTNKLHKHNGPGTEFGGVPNETLQRISAFVADDSPKSLRDLRLVSRTCASHSELLFQEQMKDVKITLDQTGFVRLAHLVRSPVLHKLIETVCLFPAPFLIDASDLEMVIADIATKSVQEQFTPCEGIRSASRREI